MKPFHDMLRRFKPATGASPEMISECERLFGIILPDDYRKFMLEMNGGEGFIGPNAYVQLWAVHDLMALNITYEVSKYLPGCIVFGTNGSGEGYGFDLRASEIKVVQVPFVGMEWDVALKVGDSFRQFISGLFNS